jgi:hypothetical protein
MQRFRRLLHAKPIERFSGAIAPSATMTERADPAAAGEGAGSLGSGSAARKPCIALTLLSIGAKQ